MDKIRSGGEDPGNFLEFDQKIIVFFYVYDARHGKSARGGTSRK